MNEQWQFGDIRNYDESLKEIRTGNKQTQKQTKTPLKEPLETAINYPEAFGESMPGKAGVLKLKKKKKKNRGKNRLAKPAEMENTYFSPHITFFLLPVPS